VKPKRTFQVGKSFNQDSASRHVTGEAIYIDDIPENSELMHAALITSKNAYSKIKKIDLSQLKDLPFDTHVFTARDIPGKNDIGPIFGDEPIMADDIISYYGQPVAVLVANDYQKAMYAAKLVKIHTLSIGNPILNIDDAYIKKSFLSKPLEIIKGDFKKSIKDSSHSIKGNFSIGGQDHFYLESHISIATPNENEEMTLWSSTQHPTEVQHGVGNVLGIPSAKIDCKTRRLGGGFGGKESQATIFAAIAALAANKIKKPVKLRLDRKTDMAVSGKRHDFKVKYEIGFNSKGKINGLDISLLSNGGNVLDLSGPVMTRALTHLDNCYSFKNFRARGYICKTNTVSNTAFRGFGGPQGMLAIENILDNVANYLNVSLDQVRNENYYNEKNGFKTPYGQVVINSKLNEVLKEVNHLSNYKKRKKAIAIFNEKQRKINSSLRKGIAMMPAKFGISFNKPSLNQAGALIHVYTDGSIRLNHGGTEMGQGLFTKVAQVVAECFGVSLDNVHITPTNTAEVPNTSATAASSGSDLNGMAAWNAAEKIKKRMQKCAFELFDKPLKKIIFRDNYVISGNQNITFEELAKKCWEKRISLSSTGFYKTPKIFWDQNNLKGRPYFYYTWGAAVSEALIDLDTGENRILRADIVEDCGKSLNEAIDIGQIQGGFVQGLGWLTCEELYFNNEGQLLTTGPSKYKIPGSRDVPTRFNVKLLENTFNEEKTIFRSKAVGEPPLLLAISHFLAIKDAIKMAFDNIDISKINSPITPSELLKCINDHKHVN
tara:strand:- start:1110 stop:3431 length:2322 start_codon:yes stop_codon:yes gene_type:complete